MTDFNTDTTVVDQEQLKKERKAQKAEDKAIRKLRFLLLRVWFIKNAFTLVIMFIVILMAFTVTGLIPPTLPILGTFSYAIKDSLQNFLEIGDNEFYTMFGSITGMFTLLWSIGFASSKMKKVSYFMIDKNVILKTILQKTNLSINNKGRIVSIENRIGIDLDGDSLIGDTPVQKGNDPDNLIYEIVETFNELSTIMNVDRETLKKTIEETAWKPPVKDTEVIPEDPTPDPVPAPEVAEAVVKKPARAFRPNKF